MLISDDDDVTCTHCGDCFVEMIEDSAHLQLVKEIYKEEIKDQEEVFYECNPGASAGGEQEEQK